MLNNNNNNSNNYKKHLYRAFLIIWFKGAVYNFHKINKIVLYTVEQRILRFTGKIKSSYDILQINVL